MIYQNIMESEEFLEVNMDPHFDNKGKSMVTGLLRHNPFMRLGMLHNGMEDIWNHSFLKGISLDQLENRKIVASYV